MNPYYPVKPCPYKNPEKAPLRLRFAIFSGPAKLLYHVGTELKWFFTTGFPRMSRMMLGREKFLVNPKILREGHHRHFTEKARTRHFGRNTYKSKAYYPLKRKRKFQRRKRKFPRRKRKSRVISRP